MPKYEKKLSSKETDKYKAIIKYIAYKHSGIGKTQLAKLFLYIDSDMYFKKKKTIAGDDYIKNHFGPTPCNLDKITKELEDEREIVFIVNPIIDHKKHELYLPSNTQINIHELVDKFLDKDEILIIDMKANYILKSNARDLSSATHQSIFHALEIGQHIPNFMLPYYFDEQLTEKELEWANGSI